MNCILNTQEQEELLLGYIAASLDAETARTYSRHLTSCEHCRDLVAMQKLVDESLADWQSPELSVDFDSKLFARIRLEESSSKSWWQQWKPAQLLNSFWGWKPALVVALATIAFAIFLTRTRDGSSIAQQSETIQAHEIEQVELALDDIEALQTLQQPENDSASGAAKKESL